MTLSDRAHRTASSGRAVARTSVDWFSGISRHGVVAANRMTHKPENRRSVKQLISLFAGSTLIGLGVSLFVHARLGVPAYDVMLTALRDRLGISLGQAGWVFTGALFVVAALLKRPPKPSGIFYILANGVAVDTFMALINDPEPLAIRILFVVMGTLSIASGVALVIHAGLTGGAIELLMRAAEDRGRDPFTVRRWIELSIVAGGVLLGGDLGIATLFFVFTMAPALKAGQQALADHRRGRAERLRPIWD